MDETILIRRFDRKPCEEDKIKAELDQYFAGRYRIYGVDRHPGVERYHVEFYGLSESEKKLLDRLDGRIGEP